MVDENSGQQMGGFGGGGQGGNPQMSEEERAEADADEEVRE